MTNQEYLSSVFVMGNTLWKQHKPVTAPLYGTLSVLQRVAKLSDTLKTETDATATVPAFKTLLGTASDYTLSADQVSAIKTLENIVNSRS